jgi:hypothetical protein
MICGGRYAPVPRLTIRRVAAGAAIATTAVVLALIELLTPPGIPDGYVYGVDASYDLLTADQAEAYRAAGVSVYAQALSALPPWGLEQPRYRIESLRNAQAAGLTIVGYALLACGNGAADMDFARQGVPDDIWAALAFIAIDVEVSCNTIEHVYQAVQRVREFGKPVVIYTSYNQWVYIMGNPAAPPAVGLWDASWDGNPDLDLAYRYSEAVDGCPNGWLVIGCWDPRWVVGQQYSGQVSAIGPTVRQGVDRNIFVDWLRPAPLTTPTAVPTATPVLGPPMCCTCTCVCGGAGQ